MKDPGLYVQSLVDLHQRSVEERRVAFRQAVTALARARVDDGPGPLEGLNPDLLALGIKAALSEGLVEDLDWLAPPAAGRALFLLAAALPVGPAQRDLGRRVLTRLFSGNAETFVAMATVMALSGGKGLASAGAHARVSLVTELPLMLGVADGPLALALVSRREFAREWITAPSTRSLPSRRLAARLLERAAREAAKRAAHGDAHALRVFRGDAIGAAFDRLLADRESLVWRHVAVARGLIAPWSPRTREEIESSVSPDLTPTEWRRAATSIAAYAAVRPDDAERMAARLFRGPLPGLDPGIGGAFVWGLPRVAEAEPDAAYLLLDFALRSAPQDVAESVLWTRDELGGSHFCDGAAKKVLGAMSTADVDDDGLREELRLDLSGAARKREPLRREVERALSAFASGGAQPAHSRGMALLEATKVAVAALDAAQEGTRREAAAGRRVALGVLRDLDASLLERNVLADLLRLETSQEKVAAGESALDALREHLGSWMLARQFAREGESPAGALDLVRIRALLHLVDGDASSSNDDPAQSARQKARWQATALAVLERVARGPEPMLRRAFIATLARCLDALVRAEELDVADAVLCAVDSLSTGTDLVALGEASMNPDMRHMLAEYVRFLGADTVTPTKARVSAATHDSLFPPPPDAEQAFPLVRPANSVDVRVAALGRFAEDLVSEGSARAEALRHVLVRLHAALVVLSKADALRGMGGGAMPDAEVVQNLEAAVVALAQVVRGARMRLEPAGKRTLRRESRLVSGGVRLLSVVVGRALVAGERVASGALAATLAELTRGLPWALATLVTKTASRLSDLPVEAPRADERARVVQGEALPSWLPARRALGAFFVQRPLGVGGSGSVFVANRLEDRHDPDAERFALKVPDYDASVARSVSEEQFLDMFRSEAMALVGLPPHPNLARFVNFDLAARPKPILVMELVEGLSLELAVESLALDMPRALRALSDLLAGLSVMHEAGLGHLDVKPSNVVLRDGEVAVLVDFGLSGRKLRPGCASGPYGAPEIWVHSADASPLAADVYAFGCLLFEVLMGEVLFDADQQVALVSSHLVHDGGPPKLSQLAARAGFERVAGLASHCLRRDPKNRPTIEQVRRGLAELSPALEVLPWPAIALSR
ncbi:MAG: serine/threonine protein kinase [Myxococcales bacterium]|nr:serine/threonine protein kinase [Myxococcales bacterium]MBL0193811.1 serine/threonine protein kinase [Myxococcales bacterium]HQY61674.1 serine/threonine-protein kinase [Polyangiaceae bacterium]